MRLTALESNKLDLVLRTLFKSGVFDGTKNKKQKTVSSVYITHDRRIGQQ